MIASSAALTAGGNRTARWLVSIVAAVVLHASVAAWVIADSRIDDDDYEADGSAMPVDITALAPSASDEIAPKTGELRPEVAASHASQSKPSEEPPPAEKSDVPIEREQVAADEVVLPKPSQTESKEQTEKIEEKTEAVQQETVASAPQEASAPAPVIAPPDPSQVSVSQGITPTQRRSRETWEKAIVTHIDKYKRYPDSARSAKAGGEVHVEFVIDRSGAVLSRKMVKGSGLAVLDAEAVDLLTRAAPLPLPPVDVRGETFHLVVPIRFRLR